MRKVVSDALNKGGHEVIGEAANGQEAVDQFQSLKPEVMTLDITMPEKDGLSALKEIIAMDPQARVVMCSALGQESKVLEAIKAGAKDFVVKPFQPDRVCSARSRRRSPSSGGRRVGGRGAPAFWGCDVRLARRWLPPCARSGSGTRVVI